MHGRLQLLVRHNMQHSTHGLIHRGCFPIFTPVPSIIDHQGHLVFEISEQSKGEMQDPVTPRLIPVRTWATRRVMQTVVH